MRHGEGRHQLHHRPDARRPQHHRYEKAQMIVAGHDVLDPGREKLRRELPGRQQGLGEIDHRIAGKDHHLARRRLQPLELRLGQALPGVALADADEMLGALSLRLEQLEGIVDDLARDGAAIHAQHDFRIARIGRVRAHRDDLARAGRAVLVLHRDAALNEFADHRLDHAGLGEIDICLARLALGEHALDVGAQEADIDAIMAAPLRERCGCWKYRRYGRSPPPRRRNTGERR